MGTKRKLAMDKPSGASTSQASSEPTEDALFEIEMASPASYAPECFAATDRRFQNLYGKKQNFQHLARKDPSFAPLYDT
jgi:hypothetical protein